MKLQRIAQAALASLVLVGCSPPSPEVEQIGFSDLVYQRVSGDREISVAGGRFLSSAVIVVTVDVDGTVIEAKPVESRFRDGWRALLAERAALAAAKKWKFHPPTYEGRPVQAVGKIWLAYVEPEIAPDTTVPFPSAAASDIEIALSRGPCFGSCPYYRVSITGEGKVRLSLESFGDAADAATPKRRFGSYDVLWPGEHEASVSPQAVAELLQKFKSTHFMGLQPEYVARVTDGPTYVLYLRVGSVSKKVVDYLGEEAGMPRSVRLLEEAVDAVAGTHRWIRGNAGTVELLKQQGFDFKSMEAVELVQSAMALDESGDDNVEVRALLRSAIEAGLNLDAYVDVGTQGKTRALKPIGVVMAQYAAENDDEALFDLLARRGQLARMKQPELDERLHRGVDCNVGIAKALVAAGANPRAIPAEGSALHVVREGYGNCRRVGSAGRVEMMQLLIDLGVPLEARDTDGWTPLMGCDDPALAAVLLKAGANPNATAADGMTALLSAKDDRVAILLLRAGADPKAVHDGRTVRRVAEDEHWPGTLAWLDAHNVP